MIIINPFGVPVTEDMTLRDLVKAAAEHGKTVILHLDDPWTERDGGERPVPKDMRVDVKLRKVHGYTYEWAGAFDWTHARDGYDIIAYRVREE